MVKNKTGGNKSKKQSNKKTIQLTEKKSLPLKGVEQEYGQITKLLGNKRFMALCNDGKSRLCHLPGSMGKFRITIGCFVLLGMRPALSASDEKCDILYLYDSNEARKLSKLKKLDEKVFKEEDFPDDTPEEEGEKPLAKKWSPEDDNLPSDDDSDEEETSKGGRGGKELTIDDL